MLLAQNAQNKNPNYSDFFILYYKQNEPLGVHLYAVGQGKMRYIRILLRFVRSALFFSTFIKPILSDRNNHTGK